MRPHGSASEQGFRAEVRAWLRDNIPPGLRGSGEDVDLEAAKAWHRRIYEAGYMGLGWPQEYGGRGLGPAHQFIWQEEYAAAHGPPMVNAIGLGWAGPAILLHGTEEQKVRYLPRILDGSEIWCQLFSEPGAGSDLAGLHTRAVPTGDGFVLNGQKVWTSYARQADRGICVARTDPAAPPHRGLSFLLVDMHDPGVEVRPIRQIDDRSIFNEVFLSDVRVASSDLVGGLNDGWRVTISTLLFERVGLSAGRGALWGSGPDAVSLVAYLRELGVVRDPVVRDKLSRVLVDAHAHRSLKLRMVTQAVRGAIPGAEASVQKLFGDEWGQRLCELAFDAGGPSSHLSRHDPRARAGGGWQDALLYSRALTIGGGTTEVQKNIIGERILGLPKEGARSR
ncbi:MAG TPA: acyl-CoA dehydrogenase family protein [Actinomycetota bacterium]|nr:acyl-CoA dehydrogenase family protein [Actinomycetota bacterium]